MPFYGGLRNATRPDYEQIQSVIQLLFTQMLTVESLELIYFEGDDKK